MPPCNCNKGATEYKFVYTDPNGNTKDYRKEIEAQAAVIRNGGGTYQPVAK